MRKITYKLMLALDMLLLSVVTNLFMRLRGLWTADINYYTLPRQKTTKSFVHKHNHLLKYSIN